MKYNNEALYEMVKEKIAIIEDQLSFYKKVALSLEDEIKHGKKALVTGDEKPTVLTGVDDTKYSVPFQYNEKLTWNEKVLFALRNIKSGFTQDIANYIISLEPNLNKLTAIDRIIITASRLKNNGVIDSEKVSKRNMYKWKK
jgi:hypothetical protein